MLRNHRRGERGQILLMTCFAAPVAFALLGFVVDVGWMYWRKEACLTAAQAGALAGIAKVSSLSSFTCNTGSLWCGTTITQCPTSLPSNNFGTACRFASANFFSPSNANQNVTVTASTGSAPTVSGASPSYYMTVRVTEKRTLSFLSVLTGAPAGWVSARATAAVFSTANNNCVYVLDPSGAASLNASNNAHVSSSCGIWDYSSATNGIYAVGSAYINATSGTVSDNGGYYVDNSGSYVNPTPTHASPGTDPLAGLVVPWTNCLNPATGATLSTCPATTCQYTGCTGSSTHCDSSQKTWSSWQATPYQFTPGIYCGGIAISNGMGAYFAPGMYVINGGGVTLNGSSTYCVGTGACNGGGGVTFYLTGTNANYGGFIVGNGSSPTLAAPSTGDLAGVLVYQDRSITAPTTALSVCNSYVPPSYGGLPAGSSSFCGGSTSNLSGILYLPTTTVGFTNGTGTGGYMGLVVKDAVLNGGSYAFSTDPYGTLSGSSGGVKSYLIE